MEYSKQAADSSNDTVTVTVDSAFSSCIKDKAYHKKQNLLLQEDAAEETGWKLVHGDVFRPPRWPKLLSALTGSGVQMFCMVLITLGKLKVCLP